MKPICIYHANCSDGMTSAWVVSRAFGGEIDLYEGRYGNEPPDVSGRDVILVDFSYKRPVLERMASAAKSVIILDHHKTAAEDLRGLDLPNLKIVFDMERSGAGIAWDHYFPNLPRPRMVDFVEDRDLWRFKYPETRAFCTFLYAFAGNNDIAAWDEVYCMDVADVIAKGEVIDMAHMKNVRACVDIAKRRVVLGGHNVPMANVPVMFASDAGSIMAQGEAFSVTYVDTANSRLFSLRSTDAGIDCGEVAKMYGGGGHRNAAGFKVPRDHELAKI